MAPLLELENVEARYGPVQALHGVSLSVGEGEIVAVLGGNGAGKTTTLRAVSGLVSTAGDVRFAGGRITGVSTIARDITMHRRVPSILGPVGARDAVGITPVTKCVDQRRDRRFVVAHRSHQVAEHLIRRGIDIQPSACRFKRDLAFTW